jgi:signal transduction histidine kinase
MPPEGGDPTTGPDAPLDRALPRRPPLSRADNPLIRAVQRTPSGVQAKLLVALLGAVVLLVVVGLLGLRAIADSNDRAEALRVLQQRATAYRALQADVEQVQQLLGLRAGGPDLQAFVPPAEAPTGASLTALDQTIATALTRLGPGGDIANLGFEVPAVEQPVLDQIAADETRLSDAMGRILVLDRAGKAAEASQIQGAEIDPLKQDLVALTDGLVAGTSAETNALIAENRSAFAASQLTFVVVAILSIVLAVVLGYALSWSVIGPIKRMETRLGAIASGDFSGRVDVPNRDELGVLATNINAMNDQLGRVYGELETASRHKSEFLANMSHELRTPLNAIIGFSEVLREEMAGPLNETQRQYVEDVQEAGQHLLSLINDILDLAKVEAGRMELALAEVSILETLESGLTMHHARATRNDITLNLSIEPDVGVVRADERKIRQVVFNLLSNAMKFTPSGGRVDVSARRHDGVVEIAVADTGVGISPADQERIFEEFQQASGPAAGSTEGTGLGLTLSKRFVELHGGRLWVQSELGAGTTFRFTLPAQAPA